VNKVKKSTLPTVSKRLAEILAIALAYVATAKLGFLVAIPPGNVTPVGRPPVSRSPPRLCLDIAAG
jgi:hypothetical protein